MESSLIDTTITFLNDFLWGYIMIALLLGAALWFTIKTRGVQVANFKEMIRLLTESNNSTKQTNGISSFKAFTISLASRVGTGNLAGVATAIAIGGPGAVFWMWVIAILGASSGFIEATLAQIFKHKEGKEYVGGPAYYMEKGLGKRWMGLLFSLIITITFGLVFNSVQSNTIALAFSDSFDIAPVWSGVAITALTAIVIFGGVRRIANVSGVLVPFMAIAYILLALTVVILNFEKIPQLIILIVKSAMGWQEAAAGAVGMALMQGIRRGLFSNEAGMGSAPNAAATAEVSHPVKQGLIQALGVFVDTLLICSCTAFIVLLSHENFDPSLKGIQLTQAALVSEVGIFGSYFISIAILFFAFSSIIGNYYYGEANIKFLTSKSGWLKGYRIGVTAMVMVGALISLETVWNLADLMMGIMALINIIAILQLGKYAFKALNDYRAQKAAGIKEPQFHASTISEIADKMECWHDKN
ncbi:MAG: alanine/glycine:cation symporter family protein [Bacteroidales bacterium]